MMDVRRAWQFPATQALLSLLSPSHAVPPTTPGALEDALLTHDSSLLAQLHAKLLRLPASSQHKWRASMSRYIANHPQYFDEHVLKPQRDDAYETTTPHERLLLLHALAEAVLSEHPPEASVDQLRPYPVGTDALRNRYWYFGDFQRVYREPGEVARKKAEKDAKVAEQHRKAAEKDARRREREEKREANEKRRDEKRKRDAEKWAPRVAAGRNTRASRRLQQKTDRQKEQYEAEEEMEVEEEHGVEDKEDTVMDDWLLREIGITTDDEGDNKESPKRSKRQPRQEEPPRRSGRRRKPVQPPASPPAKRPRKKDPSPSPPPQSPPPPKQKEFADPELRNCTHWETVSTNADELRAFIERFGPREKVAPAERSLLKRLDEILPDMDEVETRARREADRKAKTEFLLMNQKRSTRVQAINARREEEARREAEREQQEREDAAKIAAHQRAVFDAISFLVRDQSRDIRASRREFGMDEAIDRDEVAMLKQEKEKSLRMAAAAPVRRSARTHRTKQHFEDDAKLKSGTDATAAGTDDTVTDDAAEATTMATSEAITETATQADSAMNTGAGTDSDEPQVDQILGTTDITASDEPRHSSRDIDKDLGREETVGAESANAEETRPSRDADEASGRIDLEDRGTAINSMEGTMKPSPEAERSLEHERKRPRFSSASPEGCISPNFTWSANDEDKLPMRVLDKFFFASSANFVDAPLEDCELPGSDMVGFGLLIPPTTVPPNVERVEISGIVEWMFEYGGSPKIWVKSEHAWYELREPAVEYQEVFVSARRKFEICARVAIMGDTMRGAQLNFSSILDYLSYPYGEMLAYQDSDVLTEKRYIVAQMALLNKRSLLQSGFMRELQKRIRAEDRKAAQEKAKLETHEAALEMKREEEFAGVRGADMVVVTPMKTKLKRENELSGAGRTAGINLSGTTKTKDPSLKKSPKEKSITKRPPQRRSGKPVPRAVSSIVNGLFRAATKSYKTPRKRKPKAENAPKGGSSKVSPKAKDGAPKQTQEETTGYHGVKKNGTVGAPQRTEQPMLMANGYRGIPQAANHYVKSNGGMAEPEVSPTQPETTDHGPASEPYSFPTTAQVIRSSSDTQTGQGHGQGTEISTGRAKKVDVAVNKSCAQRSPRLFKEGRRVHPLVPKMIGHGMSAFVALPRQQVLVGEKEFGRMGGHVGVQNGFRRNDNCKKE